MKQGFRLLMLAGFAALLLASCQGNTQTPDPILTPENAFGGAIPDDATVVTTEEFKALTTQEGFTLDSLKLRLERKTKAAAQFKTDSDAVKNLVVQSPAYSKALIEPDPKDPNLTVLPDGNYLLTVQGNAGAFKVVTDGKPALYADMLASRQNFQNTAKQLEIYSTSYLELSDALKLGLPTPDSLVGANLEAILAARTALGLALADNPATLLDAHPINARQSSRAIPADAKPIGFPASASLEEGAGKGLDHEGQDCSTPKVNGLYQNFWWRQKFYATSIKSQGTRGSCVAFAVAAALETRIAIEKSRWVNLSEQFLWSKIASDWDAREYGDGASLPGTSDDFFDTKFGLPLESAWNYNTSRKRVDSPDEERYYYSCKDYTEFCSNASHQEQEFCAFEGAGVGFCGYKTPAVGGERFKQTQADTIYDWYSTFSLPVDEMRALLKNGHPMVAGLLVNQGYDHPNENGFITTLSDANYRGRHAVQIVGFISNIDILAHPSLPNSVKQLASQVTGGFFIIKNSWGYCMGDAGYIYIPVSWAKEYFTQVTVYASKPSAAFKSTPNSLPSIQITAPATGSSFPFAVETTFSASAKDSDGAAPTVSWTSDVDGALGTGLNITKSFTSPGIRKITATATDDQGAQVSTSISINPFNAKPKVFITTPSAGDVIWANSTQVDFSSSSISGDGLLGGLPCADLTWTSSNSSDTLGTGCSFTTVFTTVGSRLIALTGVDAFGSSASAYVSVVVTAKPLSGPPVVTITSPVGGKSFPNPSTPIYLQYKINDPGGTPSSLYQVVWSIVKPTSQTVITPLVCTIKLVNFPCFKPFDYGFGSSPASNLTLKLTVTDPEGLTGSSTVTITIGVPG